MIRAHLAALVSCMCALTACGGGATSVTAPAVPPRPPNGGLACGVERWSVKTLADPAAAQIEPAAATATTITALNDFPPHCDGGPDTRTYPEEFRVFEVEGTVIFAALEDDRDYHLALADPRGTGATLVAELADTDCQGAINSPHLTTMMGARNMFLAVLQNRGASSLVGQTFTVRGVGFYDFNHGQRGRSANCIELHPILSLEVR